MSPLDGLWHLLNFLAPAIGVALISASLAKLLWRRELAAVSWRRLVGWSTAAGLLALLAGLLVFGRDGRIATYGALITASALALWWAGFVRRD
jgi:hypothetical protein